jgi:hypothetical protein
MPGPLVSDIAASAAAVEMCVVAAGASGTYVVTGACAGCATAGSNGASCIAGPPMSKPANEVITSSVAADGSAPIIS